MLKAMCLVMLLSSNNDYIAFNAYDVYLIEDNSTSYTKICVSDRHKNFCIVTKLKTEEIVEKIETQCSLKR